MYSKALTFSSLLGLLCANSVSAQTATPTPSALSYYNPCNAVQDCASNELPAFVDSCYATSPSCVSTRRDRDAVTAALVADRAIAARSCLTRAFATKRSCHACYRSASNLVRFSQDSLLFKGLLGYSREIINETAYVNCSLLP